MAIPVWGQHDVILMKLLSTKVLPRPPVIIAVPAPRVLSANGGEETAPWLGPEMTRSALEHLEVRRTSRPATTSSKWGQAEH